MNEGFLVLSRGWWHLPWGLLWSWDNARSKVSQETGLAPDHWGALERNEFNEPRGLHLPLTRILNSLTWYVTFDIQTACSLCLKHIYILTSPPASLCSFLRATEILSPKLRVLNMSHQNNSTFMLWLYFLVDKGKVWICWKWDAWLKEGLSLAGRQWIWLGLSSQSWPTMKLVETTNFEVKYSNDARAWWCLSMTSFGGVDGVFCKFL